MDLAWCPPIVAELLHLVEYRYRTGAELDSELDTDEDEGLPLELSSPLSHAAEDMGITLPEGNRQLLAVLGRDAAPAPVRPRFGVVLETATGALAIGAGRGMVIESAGESLALIESPEANRYARAWFIPGVFYWEES